MPFFGHLWPSLKHWVLMRRRTAPPSEVEQLRTRIMLLERERDAALEDLDEAKAALREAMPAVTYRHNFWIGGHAISRQKAELIEDRLERIAGLNPGDTRNHYNPGDPRWAPGEA